MIKKILVAFDGSKNSYKALSEAIYLAQKCNATITGLCVIPTYTINIGRLLTPLKNESTRQAKKFLAKAKRIATKYGILLYEKIVYGNQAWEITEFASYKKFDLIVIGSRNLGAMKTAYLGSVSNSVVNHSKIPVLVVK